MNYLHITNDHYDPHNGLCDFVCLDTNNSANNALRVFDFSAVLLIVVISIWHFIGALPKYILNTQVASTQMLATDIYERTVNYHSESGKWPTDPSQLFSSKKSEHMDREFKVEISGQGQYTIQLLDLPVENRFQFEVRYLPDQHRYQLTCREGNFLAFRPCFSQFQD